LSGLDTTCLSRASPYYTSSLNIADAKNFIVDVKYIHKESLKDNSANYDSYVARAVKFAPTKDFYDRAELVKHMEHIICGPRGAFVCVLGGKSTGKSKLVASLSATHPASIISIDCRNGGDIVTGLIAAISAKEAGSMDTLKEIVRGLVKDVAPGAAHTLAAMDPPRPTLPMLLDTIVEKADSPITIIIDEANIALATNGSAETIAATKAALALFTRLTKQDRKVWMYCTMVHFLIF